MKTIWFFDDVNLFNILCPHKFEASKSTHNFCAFKKKDYIYFENDAANKIYLIEKGKVKIGYYNEVGEEVVKAILTRGELFGETAILGDTKREEFAQAIDDDTSVCPIAVETLHELMRKNQTLSFKVYKFIGFKYKKLERRLQLLLFKDTKTRLMEFLDDLSTDYGQYCQQTGNQVIHHPYTQKDIACLIGTSRPTLNTLLKELKEENIIEFKRKEIIIHKNSA